MLGKSETKFVEMMNKAESNCRKYSKNWNPCDLLLISAMFFPDCVTKSRTMHATVELDGKYTRGQMILNHLPRRPDNVKLIDSVSSEAIKKILEWSVSSE